MTLFLVILAGLSAIVLAFPSALAYRLGGTSKERAKKDYPYVPTFLVDGWVRNFFCSLFSIGWIYVFQKVLNGNCVSIPLWIWIPVFGLTYLASTTYLDDIFGYDNHFAHGALIGLAALPIPIYLSVRGECTAFVFLNYGIRLAIMTIGMGLWSLSTDKDDREEKGRGFIWKIADLALLIPIG